MRSTKNILKGQSLIELILAMSLLVILLPVLGYGFITARSGKAQQQMRIKGTAMLKQVSEAVRSVRETGWNQFNVNGTFHTEINGSNAWTLVSGPLTNADGFTQQVLIADAQRDSNGNLVATGGQLDPSTKSVTITVSWTQPIAAQVNSVFYFSRYLNNQTLVNTTVADYTPGSLNNTQITNSAGGEIALANNNKAKWCSPAFSSTTIDLPDGPPVAVSATASATINTPNNVFVATAPDPSTSIKMSYLTVTANEDTPVATLVGNFTMNSSEYSDPGLVPTGVNLDNNFKTNDIKFFTSSGNNLYALIATNMPDKEVIAVQVKANGVDTFQDSVNKIYQYKTYFNTRQYQGDTRSTPNQDHAPFGYGGISITTLGNRGYLASSGYLYVFDLSNIDSKSPSSGLDMVGCRIQLDGYDCNPGSGTDRKYSSGQTGATWSDTTSPAHSDCSDGGNIELYADNDVFPVKVGSNTYVFVAVGAGTNPEFNIVNVTNVPTGGTSPSISSSSCGRISGGNSGWKRISSYDFNSDSGTEEAANSVFATLDGSRAYISSNGGIDGNNDGDPDSNQLYILDTSNKSSPHFLSGTPSTGALSGYYLGTGANGQLYPRRSLTVLNGERAILVGKDGITDGQNAQEYQVLNISSEATPQYCGGVDYDQGFNDLTSVSEQDGDNFVYMVANTLEKQLKIIEGGPDDGIYVPEGLFESSTFALTASSAFNRFTSNLTLPAQTDVKLQVAVANQVSGSCTNAVFNFIGPDPADPSNSYFTQTGGVINGAIPTVDNGDYHNPGQCFRYKAFLSTTDTSQTPLFNDISINFSP